MDEIKMKSAGETINVKAYYIEAGNLKYLFWMPKVQAAFKIINVYFDNAINDFNGEPGISLNGINKIDDMKTALDTFIRIMNKSGIEKIEFQFVAHNQTQQELANYLEQLPDIPVAKENKNEVTTNNHDAGDAPQNVHLKILRTNHGGGISNHARGPIGGSSSQQYGKAAFVSLPVLMFILSALLLISSLILLFVLN